MCLLANLEGAIVVGWGEEQPNAHRHHVEHLRLDG